MNKFLEMLQKTATERWDLNYNPETSILTKVTYPTIVKLSGTLDEQVKQLRDSGFEEIVEELAASIEEDPEVRRVPFVISDASVDRHGDTADPKGWDLSQYQKTVLWGHNHNILPVAKAIKTWKHGGKLKSIAEFTPKELNPHGWAVGELVAAGFIQACSVGFIPHEMAFNEERTEDTGLWSMDFKKQELIEWSVCNVGSNRNALVESKFFEEAREIVEQSEIKELVKSVEATYADRPLSEGEIKSLQEFAIGAFTNGR